MTSALTTRRRLLQLGLAAGGTALLAACAQAPQPTPAPPKPAAAPPPTAVPAAPKAAPTVVSPQPTPDRAATVLVGDVVDFTLRGKFPWNGGSVTMKLHPAFFDGQKAYFVRTDASDTEFAKQEKLVFVPLLGNALRAPSKAVAEIYLFEKGASGQTPVVSAVPGSPNFTSLYQVHRVTFAGDPVLLDSAAKVVAAGRDGRARIEQTQIVVNYPIVKWPTGELPVDTKVEQPLEGGPLLSKPDVEKGQVAFKLHQCYPESRYIVTDTSAVPMAPMMHIAGSPGTAPLADAKATSKITVFGNGIAGPGAMGFQPGIFEQKAGHAAWSPQWDHWTAVWKDPSKATLLKSQAELDARVQAGDIVLHRGTPDTGGMGFVVNCPSPIVAPNDFVVS